MRVKTGALHVRQVQGEKGTATNKHGDLHVQLKVSILARYTFINRALTIILKIMFNLKLNKAVKQPCFYNDKTSETFSRSSLLTPSVPI